MSYKFGDKVITNGLIEYFDAAHPSSYVSGSTVVYSLSNPNFRGSLVSVNYNPSNYGGFSFNGSSSYIPTNGNPSIPNNFTIDVWCRPTSTVTVYSQTTSGVVELGTAHRFVVAADNYNTTSGAGISVGTNGINVSEHGNSFFPAPLTYATTISNTVPTNITVVYINKQPNLYINGVFIKSGLISSSSVTYMSMGSQSLGNLYGFYQGDINSVKWYNRSLSTLEVLQNYNVIKSRFGR